MGVTQSIQTCVESIFSDDEIKTKNAEKNEQKKAEKQPEMELKSNYLVPVPPDWRNCVCGYGVISSKKEFIYVELAEKTNDNGKTLIYIQKALENNIKNDTSTETLMKWQFSGDKIQKVLMNSKTNFIAIKCGFREYIMVFNINIKTKQKKK
eukprot:298737_1